MPHMLDLTCNKFGSNVVEVCSYSLLSWFRHIRQFSLGTSPASCTKSGFVFFYLLVKLVPGTQGSSCSGGLIRVLRRGRLHHNPRCDEI